MLETQDQTLLEKLADTLEQMAFMSAMPVDEAPSPEDGLLLSIRFAGPARGVVQVLTTEALGCALAANVLAVDSADPEARARAQDALRELLNITCGAMLAEIGGAAAPFEMSIPSARRLESSAQWTQALGAGGYTLLDVEGQPLAIRLSDTD